MFEIGEHPDGAVWLSGRLDAAAAPQAQAYLDGRDPPPRELDLARLEYVSSAGLGVLLKSQKRALGAGAGLTLARPSRHLRDILRYSGFDRIFTIRDE